MRGWNRVAQAAAWLARAQATDEQLPPPSAEQRRRTIEALEEAIAGSRAPARRTGFPWWQKAAVAALLLGAGFGVGSFSLFGRSRAPSTVASVLGGHGRVDGRGLSRGLGVQGDQRIETDSTEGIQLAWAGLATITAEPESAFALVQLGHQHLLRLDRGAVALEVTPLPPDEKLLVETLDLSVEVRGTAFRVAIVPSPSLCDGRGGTEVEVRHGLVAIREKGKMVAALGAGQSWPTCQAAHEGGVLEGSSKTASEVRGGGAVAARRREMPKHKAAHRAHEAVAAPSLGREIRSGVSAEATLASETPPAAPPGATEKIARGASGEVVAAHRAVGSASVSPVVPVARAPLTEAPASGPSRVEVSPDDAKSEEVAPPSSSDLGRQNDLFALALTAGAQGKSARALTALKQLIERWPQGALAENARAEKMRLLRRMGRTAEAVAAARDYLAYHPSGFAHAEAASLVAAPSL